MLTREAWLVAAARQVTPIITQVTGLAVPRTRISCGDLGPRTLGRCYGSGVAPDKVREISISIDHDGGEVGLLGTVTHELIHAAGCNGHRRDFQKAARLMELKPKGGSRKWGTATFAGPVLTLPPWAQIILRRLGEYPAPAIKLPRRGGSGSRMIKVQCYVCRMIWRTAAVNLDRDLRCPDAACGGDLQLGF